MAYFLQRERRGERSRGDDKAEEEEEEKGSVKKKERKVTKEKI